MVTIANLCVSFFSLTFLNLSLLFITDPRGDFGNCPYQDEGNCRGLPWKEGYPRSRDGPGLYVRIRIWLESPFIHTATDFNARQPKTLELPYITRYRQSEGRSFK
jgi:hypothetical protein